jgi:hypothetical protein
MGIETNATDQNKALLPAFHFNWSQMESVSIFERRYLSERVRLAAAAAAGHADAVAISVTVRTHCVLLLPYTPSHRFRRHRWYPRSCH